MKPSDLVVTRNGARFMGHTIPCVVGRGGIGTKQGEGDNVTPVGIWNVTGFLVRPDRAYLPTANPIGLRDAWCDDPKDHRYNQMIQQNGPGDEKLRRGDPMYNIIGVLDYNTGPVIPGAGSAIFLHIWRRPAYPTAGCIAFSPTNMRWIAENWMDGQVIIRG